MKRATVLLVATGVLLAAGPARGDQTWTQNQHATNLATGAQFSLDGLPAPVLGKFSPLRLDDLTLCAGGPLWVNATGLPFRCATIGNTAGGADLQAPLAPADGTIVMPTAGTIRVGAIPGTGVTGTPNTLAWFNGSGVLNSLTLAPEFALTTGTLSLTANGVANAKLATMPARSFKVNATNATGTPSELACGGAGQVPQDTGTALVCQQLAYSSLSGSVPAITSLTGPITATGPGAAATTITNSAVTYAKIQNETGGTFLGNPTGSPAPPSEVSPVAPLTFSGTNFQLNIDTSLNVAAGILQRNALTGAVTAAAGSNATAFGSQAALSLFGVAGNGAAIPAPIVASVPLTVPMLNAGGTAVAWSPLTAATTSGIVATWPITSERWYCVDGTNGNDSNVGFSDTNESDCGTKAKQTIAGLKAVFPPNGSGRAVKVVIAAGTYSDGLTFLNGVVGYVLIGVIGTGTQSNAGAVAFDGTNATDVFGGGVTVPGLNAGGYNPTGSPTTRIFSLQLNGGGSPALPAEPAAPLGWRIRFSSSTSTVALRGACAGIAQVSGGNAITAWTALPATPTTADVFYIEKAGVIVGATTIAIGQDVGLTSIGGIDLGATTQTSGNVVYVFSGVTTFNPQSPGVVQSNRIWQGNLGGPSAKMGGGLHVSGAVTNSAYGAARWPSLAGATFLSTVELLDPPGLFAIVDGTTFAQGIAIQGAQISVQNLDSTDTFGSLSAAPTRVIGSGTYVGGSAGILLRGTAMQFNALAITGVGGVPAIKASGINSVAFVAAVTGSTGNTDVGLDLTASYGSTFSLQTTPTVTGTAGDVRLCDGTIVSWATAAAGLIDKCGNALYSAGFFPQFLKDPGSNGIVVRTGAGATANRTLTNSDGTIAFTFPDGVAGNPVINTTGLTPSARTVTGTAPINIAGDHAAHDLSANRTWALDANGVTYPFLQQGGALSIPGRASNSLGNWADISATAGAGGVFRESGSTLGFGSITESAVTNLTTDLSGKQATGNYLTALTGDVTAAGPGSAAATLASVITPGSCTNCNLTYDGKGRVTVAANGSAGVSWPATPDVVYSTGSGPAGSSAFVWDNPNNRIVLNNSDSGGISLYMTKVGLQEFAKANGRLDVGTTTPDLMTLMTSNASRLTISSAGDVAVVNLSGTGTRCVHADASGVLSPTASDCGLGGGSVTGVTASAPLASTGGTAPNISLNTSGVAAGTYITPAITVDGHGLITAASFTNTYQLVESDGTPVTGEATLNFHTPLHAADNSSPFRTEITINDFFGSGVSHARGIVPDPGSTAGSRRFLNESAAWIVPPVAVTSADATPDYLINKIGSTTGSVAVSTFAGGPSGLEVNLNVNPAGISLSSPMEAALNYTVSYALTGAGTPGGWYAVSSLTPGVGFLAGAFDFEYPLGVSATSATLKVKVLLNGSVSDSTLIQITRNGTAIGTGVTVDSTTTAGTVLSYTTAIAGGAASDVYGVKSLGSGSDVSGNIILDATAVIVQ